MSHERPPLVSNDLETLIAEHKSTIIDACSIRLERGRPLEDPVLAEKYRDFDKYFAFLACLLTNRPATETTRGVTRRGFHFGYFLSTRVIHSGLIASDFYEDVEPARLADKIIVSSNGYLDGRPHIDSVVAAFTPELVGEPSDRWAGLARISVGLALQHVEAFQLTVQRQRTMDAMVEAFGTELAGMTADDFKLGS